MNVYEKGQGFGKKRIQRLLLLLSWVSYFTEGPIVPITV